MDGEPFGFLRSRHAGVGAGAQLLTEAWLFDADDIPAHRDGVRYLNTRSSRSEAMADIAGWRTFYRREQEDRSPVFGVVLDERREKYGPTVPRELQDHFLDGTLDFYGVGLLRPHPRHGRFHADALTFTWGIVAPCGLEGIYTQVDRVPKSLADYAPRSP
ncbi:hypothetical protein [Streptomyces flavofungini]|uniref:Uncharacterized protein n=1 Tax=Streptomyces flavofungini TaxID=68200 RepID=A0ABS0XGF0_9ACTN|nr:hypothetical protein [Streptomyces flavofungini]MBJ3812306.1 hypothetical protein [Streptomyces flavofungini]